MKSRKREGLLGLVLQPTEIEKKEIYKSKNKLFN